MPRPAGIPKTGGRREGTPNKATATREAEIRASGVTPLDFMLGVMRDNDKTVELRLEAAAKAAPYVHPRLSSVALGNKDGEPFQISVEDRQREIAERHERSRRLLDEVFDEVVITQKPGAPNADRSGPYRLRAPE